jgi:hypothetical protein
MIFNFRAVRGLRQQPLLVCVRSPAFGKGSAADLASRAGANVFRLIKLWEAREAPFTAVRSDREHAQVDGQASPEDFAAGERVFESVRCSILRNEKFRCFHNDIGSPSIIMIGGGLESTIIASAIDAYWFNVPFTVIGDAVYPDRSLTEQECGTALKILSNFVDIVDVAFVEND